VSDYLWDKSGKPDPEIVKLEEQLGALRYQRSKPKRPVWIPLLAAAALLLAVFAYYRRPLTPSGPSFEVARIEGDPRIQSRTFKDRARLGVGWTLETDHDDIARIDMVGVGHVRVLPKSLLRLVETRADKHRLSLERGSIHVSVNAPPRLFVVDTSAAQAIDLGCEYVLTMSPEGVGTLDVRSGRVELEGKGRKSTVPAGAMCGMRNGAGPGTPYFSRSAERLRAALDQVDAGDIAALDRVISATEPYDTLTLIHLLERVPAASRAKVYERLAELSPPPPAAVKDAVLELAPAAVNAWRTDIEAKW
jgi:hypothetical protein